MVVLALLVLLPGCKRARQEAFEQRAREASGADNVRVEDDGKRVTLSGRADGSESEVELGESARIPADFPKSVPIYPGAKLVAAVGTTDQGKRSHVVTLSTSAGADVVYDFYKQRLPSFGSVEEISLGGMRMLSADNGAGTTLEVMITADGQDGSTVQLMTNAS
jgi:hypothetical protein